MEQVLLVPDQRSVKQFPSAALDPALRDRVHPRDPDSAENDPDARVGEDGVEQCRELAVPVADREPHGLVNLEILGHLRWAAIEPATIYEDTVDALADHIVAVTSLRPGGAVGERWTNAVPGGGPG
ncbi:hypothetical protein ACFXGA_30620 [Actinosynnema sp. NPDC059335]|uniref:hypothetical protein n=1 Tax=Actinosynnema sp. NPDC059335 TaxID=3346804 RepID=UPI00366CA6B7